MYWISIHFTEINNISAQKEKRAKKHQSWQEKAEIIWGEFNHSTASTHIHIHFECTHMNTEQSIRCEWLLRWITFTVRGLTIQINICILCTLHSTPSSANCEHTHIAHTFRRSTSVHLKSHCQRQLHLRKQKHKKESREENKITKHHHHHPQPQHTYEVTLPLPYPLRHHSTNASSGQFKWKWIANCTVHTKHSQRTHIAKHISMNVDYPFKSFECGTTKAARKIAGRKHIWWEVRGSWGMRKQKK